MNSTVTQLSPPPVRILVAEDEPEIRDYLQLALRRPNFIIDFAENGEEVLSLLAQGGDTPALIILDVIMPYRDGISTLREIRKKDPALPIIMLSGLSAPVNIVEAMKSGANDFLTKPISHEALRQAVDQLLPVKVPVDPSRQGELLLGSGNWSKRLEPLLDRISTADVPVLLQGETGSGKEVLARRIHDQSLRSGQTFLKLNCAALPAELVESELLGYERGAFTGAFKTNPGKFELANGGTIFLDEIGDMDLKLQAKLLQVLQDQEFIKLGARETTRVDVRVIAATHCDLEMLAAQGLFRMDLYYRLNVVNIVIPALRERRDEIIPLASLFLKRHNRSDTPLPQIGPDLKTALLDYHWPGNVRELENLMRRYLVIRDSNVLLEELRKKTVLEIRPPHSDKAGMQVRPGAPPSSAIFHDEPVAPKLIPFQPSPPNAARIAHSDLAKVDEERRKAETDVILNVLNSTLWNRKRAAALLGIDYKAFLYKMKKLGIAVR